MTHKPNIFAIVAAAFLSLVIIIGGSQSNLFASRESWAEENVYFVSPAGNDDSGDGSEVSPWKTIGKAIIEASDGDTIEVMDDNDDSITDYEENPVVGKQLCIKRYDDDDTPPLVQAADPNNSVFEVIADNVIISGLAIKGATGSLDTGIYLHSVADCTISGNNLENNYYGIYLNHASGNRISGNNDNNNDNCGIYMWNSSGNVLSNNNADNNGSTGIYLSSSSGNTIFGNRADNNESRGIYLRNSSDNNTIYNNNADNNMYGIVLSGSSSNAIYFNTFYNNESSDISSGSSSVNCWRSPTAFCYLYQSTHKSYLGNYYSDYNGNDENNDGIGDTPYDLPGDEPDDEYPLIRPFDCYPLQTWWLQNDAMDKGDQTGPSGSISIGAGLSSVLKANYPAAQDSPFLFDATWTGRLTFASAPQTGDAFTIDIGYSDGTTFTAGGPQTTVQGDGTRTAFTFETQAAGFTVPAGTYLALKITNTSTFDYSIMTGAGSSYISSPESDPGYPNEALKPDFSAAPTQQWINQDIGFTDQTTGDSGPFSCLWNFGDGTTSTESNPTHSYDTAGIYTVYLVATDSHGNKAVKTREQYITAAGPLSADFTSETIVETYEQFRFLDTTKGGFPPYTYEWDFDNDGTVDSTESNPDWSYPDAGTYTVSLKVTDSKGNQNTLVREGLIKVFTPRWTLESVGNFGGMVACLAHRGDYVYLGRESALSVMDMTGETPLEAARIKITEIKDIFISGSYAYIVNGEGLYVVNISDSAAPVVQGFCKIESWYKGVHVFGDYAYVADGDGVNVVNITDPLSPQIVGSLDIDGIRDVFIPERQDNGTTPPSTVVMNEVFPVCGEGGEWIELYNPASQDISLVDWRLIDGDGQLNYLIPATGSGWNGTLEAGGYHVIQLASEVLDDQGDSLTLSDDTGACIDFMKYGDCQDAPPEGTSWSGTSPEPPVAGQSLGRDKNSADTDGGADWENTGGMDAGVPTAAKKNFTDFLYAVSYYSGGKKMWLIDITSPEQPSAVASVVTEGNDKVFVSGNYAYVANGWSRGMGIFDVRDALHPASIGSFGGDTVVVKDVFVAGDHAYLAGGTGFLTVDVTDPANPVQAGELAVEGQISCIRVSPPYAYISTAGDVPLYQINITTPASPVIVKKTEEPTAANCSCVSDQYLYVASNEKICVYDIASDGDNPPLINSYPLPSAACLFAQGDYLYAIASGYMHIINVSDKLNLTEEAAYQINGSPSWAAKNVVYVVGGYAYLVTSSGKLVIIDISTPSTPVEKGLFELPDYGINVFVRDDIAHVGYAEGFVLIDVSNPEAPVQIGENIATSGEPSSISVEEYTVGEETKKFAFLGSIGGDWENPVWYLEAFDVSKANDNTPEKAAEISSLGQLSDMEVHGNTVHIVTAKGVRALSFDPVNKTFTFTGKEHSSMGETIVTWWNELPDIIWRIQKTKSTKGREIIRQESVQSCNCSPYEDCPDCPDDYTDPEWVYYCEQNDLYDSCARWRCKVFHGFRCSDGTCRESTSRVDHEHLGTNEDYYDDWVIYCKDGGSERWQHRLYHHFTCSGTECSEKTSWKDDQFVDSCPGYYWDDWEYYCEAAGSGEGDWVMKHRLYHQPYCEGGYCKEKTEWVDDQVTGQSHYDYTDDAVLYCKGNEAWSHRLFHDYSCEAGVCSETQEWIEDQSVEKCHDDYYGEWKYYCNGSERWKHRQFHDFSCNAGACKETTDWVDDQKVSDCDILDYYDDWEYYCKAGERWKHRQSHHDFLCNQGECKHTTDWVDDQIEPCPSDGWYEFETQWIDDPDRPGWEKERVYEKYLDYSCASGDCPFIETDDRWRYTENTREIPGPGDVYPDTFVDFKDAIVSLQAVARLNLEEISKKADVNGDGKIGLAEIIYILQHIAGLREIGEKTK